MTTHYVTKQELEQAKDEILAVFNNHLNTLDKKIDGLAEQVGGFSQQVGVVNAKLDNLDTKTTHQYEDIMAGLRDIQQRRP